MRKLTFVVGAEDDGRLIKRVVRGRMGISHRGFSDIKNQHAMLVDGRPVLANYCVHAGEVITLYLPEDPPPQPMELDDTPIEVAYEDQDILIVNKPAPLASQSSPRQVGFTLANRVAYYYRDQKDFAYRPVNRLDKGTSGLMVIARHAHAQHLMQQMLHGPDFVRGYEAIVEGALCPPEGTIDLPILKAPGATVRRMVGPGGKQCVTHYKTLEQKGGLSRLTIRLETGRTHQIRVHMAHMGCPVVGDFLYGKEDERLPGRFALHSAYLSCLQPVSGERVECRAPLPVELERLMRP